MVVKEKQRFLSVEIRKSVGVTFLVIAGHRHAIPVLVRCINAYKNHCYTYDKKYYLTSKKFIKIKLALVIVKVYTPA